MAKKPKKATKITYYVGDLVLAKVKGHPLWPATIHEIPKPGKYVVKFFNTDQIASSLKELKPFDASIHSESNQKNESLIQAYKQCREQYEKLSSSIRSDEDSPLCIEEEQEVKQVLDDPEVVTKEVTNGDCSPNDLTKEQKRQPEEVANLNCSSIDSTKEQRRKPEKIANLISSSADLTKEQRRKPEEVATVDCSLNDLTSEQANAERGVKKSLPDYEESPEANTNARTIEKLKKKLQKKLDEKEGKKKNHREKKEFQKAVSVMPKFVAKFRSLLESGEEFKAKPDDKNLKKLNVSMNNCSNKCLKLLEKCVVALSNEYGRTQKESKDFHSLLQEVVKCLKEIRDMRIKDIHKNIKSFLSNIKKNDKIKEFINRSEDSPNTTKDEFIVERKENARKRLKLSR